MDLKPVLDAPAVERLIAGGFQAEQPFFLVEALEPGGVRGRMPFRRWMLRPGGVVSGPALFTAADLTMYALVLAHVGPQLMAVTANLNLNFLHKGAPADLRAEGRLLRLGRRQAVMSVDLRCGDDPRIVAHATGSYSLPAARPPAA